MINLFYIFILYIHCFMYISSTPCINFEVSLRPGFTFFFMAWNVSYGLAVIWHGMVAASYTQKIKKKRFPLLFHPNASYSQLG